jgi:hypothetical protein
MLRFNFMLTERNRKMLEQSVRVTGLSYSETIRRLLDKHLVLPEEDEVDVNSGKSERAVRLPRGRRADQEGEDQ